MVNSQILLISRKNKGVLESRSDWGQGRAAGPWATMGTIPRTLGLPCCAQLMAQCPRQGHSQSANKREKKGFLIIPVLLFERLALP